MKLKWDLEDSCNLRCKHCIVGTTSYPPSISLEKAKKVIDKCHESGVDNIVLSTKEPFILDSRINMTRLVPQLRVLHKSQPA